MATYKSSSKTQQHTMPRNEADANIELTGGRKLTDEQKRILKMMDRDSGLELAEDVQEPDTDPLNTTGTFERNFK